MAAIGRRWRATGWSGAVAVLVVAGACTGSETSPAQSGSQSTTGALVTEEARSPDRDQVWGSGRARAARYDTASDLTVVATTLGVQVQQGDAAAFQLTDEQALTLALAPDARRVAFTTAAGRLELWELGDRRRLHRRDVILDRIGSLHFAGDTLVVAGPDRVALIEPDGSERSLVTARSADTIAELGAVAWSPTGELAVPVSDVRPWLAVWSPISGMRRVDLGLPDGAWLDSVAWAPDRERLAVQYSLPDKGGQLAVWQAGALTPITRLPGLVEPGKLAFVAADVLVFELDDRVVAFTTNGRELAALPSGPPEVQAILADGDAVVVVRYDGSSVRWVPGREPVTLTTGGAALDDLDITGRVLVATDSSGVVREVDLATATPIRTVDSWVSAEITSVDISAANDVVATASSTGAVRLLRLSDGREIDAFDQPNGRVGDLALAPAGDVLAAGLSVELGAGTWDDGVSVVDLDRATTTLRIGGEREEVVGCAFYQGDVGFSPDGRWLAVSSHDFTVQVVDLAAPEDVRTLEPHASSLLDLGFSPSGDWLVTSADDGTMRVWDVDRWELEDEITAAPGGYWSMTFAPDGSTLAVIDLEGRISLVDLDSGEVVRRLRGRADPEAGLAFSPDGRWLVSAAADGSVQVRTAADGRIEAQLRGHTLPVAALDVTADSSGVVTGSSDGTVRYWKLP